MTPVDLTLLALSAFIGLLGMPIGILPSIFLFRDLANGTDSSEKTKRTYSFVLWGGIFLGWLVATFISWKFLSFVVS